MSLIDDPMAEWKHCQSLTQRNIDRFQAEGVTLEALVHGPGGVGVNICQDRVDAQDRRFEFERYLSHTDTRAAFVALALDREARPIDLVAWRPDRFIASWLGVAGVLGEDQVDYRFGEPLVVHPNPLAWLKAGRRGIVIIDPIRAAPLLRSIGTMEVGSYAERGRLNNVMRVELPRIIVRSFGKVAAE